MATIRTTITNDARGTINPLCHMSIPSSSNPGSAGIVAGSHGFEEDRGFEEEGMDMWHNGLIVPLASFVMVVLIVAIASMRKMREKELEAHRELRMREMEHEQKMKQMEIERSRLELEKAKVTKNA